MKKIVFYLLASCFLLTINPVSVKAAPASVTTSVKDNKALESAEAKALLARIDEIKAMDKSQLSSAERKALRKEVRTLKTQVASIGGGVYLSAGAIIIIALVLILLL